MAPTTPFAPRLAGSLPRRVRGRGANRRGVAASAPAAPFSRTSRHWDSIVDLHAPLRSRRPRCRGPGSASRTAARTLRACLQAEDGDVVETGSGATVGSGLPPTRTRSVVIGCGDHGACPLVGFGQSVRIPGRAEMLCQVVDVGVGDMERRAPVVGSLVPSTRTYPPPVWVVETWSQTAPASRAAAPSTIVVWVGFGHPQRDPDGEQLPDRQDLFGGVLHGRRPPKPRPRWPWRAADRGLFYFGTDFAVTDVGGQGREFVERPERSAASVTSWGVQPGATTQPHRPFLHDRDGRAEQPTGVLALS